MIDFASRFEKCERAIEQLRGELDALQSVMHRHLDDIITAMLLRMDRMDTVLGAGQRCFNPHGRLVIDEITVDAPAGRST